MCISLKIIIISGIFILAFFALISNENFIQKINLNAHNKRLKKDFKDNKLKNKELIEKFKQSKKNK